MKKIITVLLVMAMVLGLAACGQKNNNNSAGPTAMTYEEYMAAADEAKVVIEGYVQVYAYSAQYNNVNMFIMDEKGGAYYAYRADCSQEQAKQLAEGIHVRVSGNKGNFKGEIELQEHCTFEILSGNKIFPAADISSSLNNYKALEGMMNQKVGVNGLVVENIYDGDGKEASFLYNWDGSGQAGANNDVYFNASYNGVSYNFVVESDEFKEGTDTYTSATRLNVGDVIDIEAFLYWYNGPNMHVSKIDTVKASIADTIKGDGVMTHSQFTAAKEDQAVVVEGYIQGLTAYNTQYKNFNAYLADAEGSYYAYRIAASEEEYKKLGIGDKVRITGYKAFYHDMPEIAEGCKLELLEGYYVAPTVNVTAKLADTDALKDMIGSRITLKGLKVVPSKVEGDPNDYPFLYNWNGTGSAGANQDVYFMISDAEGKTYSVCIESDEQPEGSAGYTAATGLNLGDEIDLDCFIYWYDGPQFHVQDVRLLRK